MNMTKKFALLGISFALLYSRPSLYCMQQQPAATETEDDTEEETEEEEEEAPTVTAPIMPLTGPINKPLTSPQQLPIKPITTPAKAPVLAPQMPTKTPAPPQMPATKPIAAAPVPAPTPGLPVNQATAQTFSPEKHKAEIEQINQDLKTIDTLKDTLKQLLEQCDDQLEKGRTMAAEAQAKSLDALKAKTDADAQKIKAAMDENLASLKKMQQDMQVNVTKNFQTTASQIKELITRVETSIKQLQEKGAQFKLTQAKALPQEIKKRKTALGRLKQEVIPPEKQKDESLGRYLVRRTGDFIVGFVGVIYTIYDALKNMIVGEKKTSTEEQPPHQKQAQPAMPLPQAAPQAPQKTPIMPVQMPTKAVPSAHAEGTLNQYEQLIAKLENDRNQLEEQTLQLDSSVDTLRQTLEENQAVGKYIDDHYPWKQTLLHAVSSIIDGGVYLIKSSISGAKKIFYYYLKPAAKQISEDVQKKVKEDEEKEVKAIMTLKEPKKITQTQAIPSMPQTK